MTHSLHRYIDQCQELLDAPATTERKDLEVYAQAIQTGKGEGLNLWSEDFEVPKEFVAYVERSSTYYLESGKKEAFPVTFNYERWLTST